MAIKSNKRGKSFDFKNMEKIELKDKVGEEIIIYYKKKIKGQFGYTWLLILDENEKTYGYAPSSNLDDLEDGFENEDCPVKAQVVENESTNGRKYLKLYW